MKQAIELTTIFVKPPYDAIMYDAEFDEEYDMFDSIIGTREINVLVRVEFWEQHGWTTFEE